MKLALLLPESNEDYDKQLIKFAEHLPDNTLSISPASLTPELIEINAVRVLISSWLSLEWSHVLHDMGIVSIVFGPRNYYYEIADIVFDYKSTNEYQHLMGPEVDFNHVCPSSYVEVASLVKNLEWDSNFFGFNIAFVSCLQLSENICKAIDLFLASNNIRLLQYLCNCHDRRSVLCAEKEGFSFVDIRMTLQYDIARFSPRLRTTEYTFRKARDEDIAPLQHMARDMYKNSRYYYDENFSTDKACDFYTGWIQKAVKGEFDDECWCLVDEKTIIAFCSLRYSSTKTAQIGLLGVHHDRLRKGIGKEILWRVIEMLSANRFAELRVVTQGRNYPAQNLYQSIGFRTNSTQLWYHKWL